MRHSFTPSACVVALFVSSASYAASIQPCDPMPKALDVATPGYWESRTPQEGTVVVVFTIDLSGHTRDVAIATSTNSFFNARAMESVLKWTFAPPKAACTARMPISFKIGETN